MPKFLCAACRHLSAEQLQEIKPCNDIVNLRSWYVDHLISDFRSNTDAERDFALQEAKRIGFDFIVDEKNTIEIVDKLFHSIKEFYF